MGDKNIFKKSSKLFTKDGFYITLFVCLCIVAVAAVYISKNNANTAKQMAENQKQIEQQKDTTEPTLVDDGKDKSVPTMQQPSQDKKTSSTSTNKGSKPAKATSSTTSNKAKFSMPVEGQITKNYSNDELQQSVSMESDEIVTYWETHEAIDISCDLGTEVKAAGDGKVVKVINDDSLVNGVLKTGMGVTVLIDHNNGIQTAYSCLGDTKVKEGASVKKGQVIGAVGNISTRELAEKEGSHLHFAVFKKNKDSYIAVNPLDYLDIKK